MSVVWRDEFMYRWGGAERGAVDGGAGSGSRVRACRLQAAFLSSSQYTIHGPGTLAALREAQVCAVGLPFDEISRWVGSIYEDDANRMSCRCFSSNYTRLESCATLASGLCHLDTDAETRRCHSLLDQGKVSAIVSMVPSLNDYLRNHCDSLVMSDYRFSFQRVALAFPSADPADPWPLHARHNLSVAINHITKSPVIKEIERINFGSVVCRMCLLADEIA